MSDIRDVIQVVDNGDYYNVVRVSTINRQFIDPGKIFLPVSGFAKEIIQRELDKGASVSLPKVTGDNEVLVGNLIVTMPDNPLDIRKNILKSRVRSRFANFMVATKAYDFFGMFAVAGQLAAKGHLITDINRQEKYLEIMNSGDEELLTMMTEYIDLKDLCQTNYDEYKASNDKIIAIENAADDRELDLIDPGFVGQ